jgi:hypothetical protein
MMAQMEYQAQEITEKIGQLKALKEEMERKEQLFEECSRQLQVWYGTGTAESTLGGAGEEGAAV